jgi:hypothetical protein
MLYGDMFDRYLTEHMVGIPKHMVENTSMCPKHMVENLEHCNQSFIIVWLCWVLSVVELSW